MDDPTSTPTQQQKRPRVAEENRKRAVRACDGCRRVKEKCEGGVPCRRCLRYRRQCNFTHIDPTEKTRSTSVSLSDRAASVSRHEIAEAERVRCMERLLSHYVPNITFDIQSLRQAADELKTKHRDSESDVVSTKVDANELEDLAIDEEDFTIKALPDNTTPAPDASTEVELFEDRWRATQLQSSSPQVSASITCLPPRYVAEFLVQIFFKYAQTNNFYVEEDWLCEKLNICYTNPSDLSSDDAVCTYGIAHAGKLSPSDAAQDHHFSEDEVGLTFYQFASKLLPDIIANASVRSVQACLLIGTYLLPLDTSGLCYTYFGLALKLAIQNGMHRRYHGEGLSPRMIEVRNRVFWTSYTIEKRISILHGRPASLADADVDAPFPIDFPGLMPASQPSNHTNMIALITLTLKLGQVSNEITSLRTSPKGQQQDCLERLLNIRKNLLEWWSTLPEESSCRDLNPNGVLFRSNVHLKLDYCLTRIFIGRPFLFSNIKALSQTPTAFKGPTGISKNRATLVTDCVEAALEIIDLCRLLRDETGLARASFTEFSSCRAALLVILAQGLTKRTERLGAALEQGISLIKIMSMGVGSARSAVSVIEALERAIRRLEMWSESQQTQNNGNSMESAYDRFKNWEMLWKTGPVTPSTMTWKQEEAYANDSNASQGLSQTTPGPSAAAAVGSGISVVSPSLPLTTGAKDGEIGIPGPDQDILDGDMPSSGLSTSDNFSLSHPSLSQMPHFGFDHFVSNFPQELGEFTAIPCFEPDNQGNPSGLVNPDLKVPSGTADSHWLQFMND
ncbi:hypothetical protein N7450_002786 [Penicillium hetheringtonii]|uniref:Zn(2)-C6 fungal-type domain-containing protein n=1 Tax=Penicillium hetheringtonii TaxID=911720 RepID=A0AAD6DWQ3_9EURO|nr:hypothetical protein N7450_002786 [Penicillium hetheringtonii]